MDCSSQEQLCDSFQVNLNTAVLLQCSEYSSVVAVVLVVVVLHFLYYLLLVVLSSVAFAHSLVLVLTTFVVCNNFVEPYFTSGEQWSDGFLPAWKFSATRGQCTGRIAYHIVCI